MSTDSKKLTSVYEAWKEIEGQIKALRQDQSELVADFCQKADLQKSNILTAFRFQKKKEETGADHLDDVASIIVDLERRQ